MFRHHLQALCGGENAGVDREQAHDDRVHAPQLGAQWCFVVDAVAPRGNARAGLFEDAHAGCADRLGDQDGGTFGRRCSHAHTLPSHAACGYAVAFDRERRRAVPRYTHRSVLPNPAQIGSALSDLIGGGSRRRERPDYRQAFYLALARVLGAAAWIDAPINQDEVNVVKSLLNELSPRLTARELQSAQRYLGEPVPRAHWDDLLVALAEFTRRRTRLQFALQRLQLLLAADGEPTEVEQRLFGHVQAMLDWRGRQPDSAAGQPEQHAKEPDVGIRLGDLSGAAARGAGAPLVERVHEAAAGRLDPKPGAEVPRRLAVWAAAVAHVTVRRARTEGEDAELVGFLAAVVGVHDAAAEAALEAAREQPPSSADHGELAAELCAAASVVEVASLAQLLNAAAGGDAALHRLQRLSAGMTDLTW